ncbi:MAG TPA: LCP family protein [Thermomicrobiales bacterium]|nr:LCP family protein [Thermomicrobiales bacterium]
MSETEASGYFKQVQRRAQQRTRPDSDTSTGHSRRPNIGGQRYKSLRQRSDQTSTPLLPTATSSTVVKTTPIAPLGSALAALQAAQVKHAEPKWWARFAAHPVKSGIAAVLLVVLITFTAIAAPIAMRSYTAYRHIFNTPVPQQPNVLQVAENAQGTPQIIGINPNQQLEVADWDGTSRITILLMGVDRREDEVSRSDTMILVNIDPVAKKAWMMSIPRDLQVFVPGKGVYKINAAYALGDADDSVAGGGPGLAVRTIEANFGIDISYYAEVDFKGLVKIVDTVGGITVDVPYPLKDNEYPGPDNQYMRIYFPAGWQHMDGDKVLQYSRTRHDDSDLYRAQRQQQVLLALRQQAVSLDLWSKAPELIQEMGNTVGTDLSLSQSLSLAKIASEIQPEDITQLTMDGVITAYEDPEYYFAADWSAVGDLMTELTGEKIVPQNATIGNPNLSAQVTILDGTLIYGLGPRVLEVVHSLGFSGATTTDLPDAGVYPTTQIIVSQDNLATGVFLARSLGVPDTAVQIVDNPTTPTPVAETSTPNPTEVAGATIVGTIQIPAIFPTSTASSDSGSPAAGGTIIIRLGDDLPDPAWYNPNP